MGSPLYFEDIATGQGIGPLVKTPTTTTLFMYSAAVWLVHRIHYDHQFATENENLPNVVVHGTLAADWYAQMLSEWAGAHARVWRLAYQNRGFMIPGEVVTCGGSVLRTYVEGDDHRVECELWIRRPDGQNAVTGSATVLVPPRLNGAVPKP